MESITRIDMLVIVGVFITLGLVSGKNIMTRKIRRGSDVIKRNF